MATQRPTGVTIVAIVVLVSGLLSITGAIISLTTGGHVVSAIVSLALGILTTIVLVLQLAGAIFSLGATGFGTISVIWPIIAGLLALVGIALLYTKQANAYFR